MLRCSFCRDRPVSLAVVDASSAFFWKLLDIVAVGVTALLDVLVCGRVAAGRGHRISVPRPCARLNWIHERFKKRTHSSTAATAAIRIINNSQQEEGVFAILQYCKIKYCNINEEVHIAPRTTTGAETSPTAPSTGLKATCTTAGPVRLGGRGRNPASRASSVSLLVCCCSTSSEGYLTGMACSCVTAEE